MATEEPALAAQVARLAAGAAQSSASCLMFSMETGSSGLRALSGVAASTCSSFTRTAMTEEGGGGGERERGCACNAGRVGAPDLGKGSHSLDGGLRMRWEKAQAPSRPPGWLCQGRCTYPSAARPAKHEVGRGGEARLSCLAPLRSGGGCFGSSSAQWSEKGCLVPRKFPSKLTVPFCARWGRRGAAPEPCPPARPGLLLSSGAAPAETFSVARGSSSSRGFLDPCLRGRVLVGGILFPLNKIGIKPGIRVTSMRGLKVGSHPAAGQQSRGDGTDLGELA